jgi:uncharacterized MAPEG superfamily protein
MTDVHYLLASTVLTWIMLVTAPMIRNREWTPDGLRIGFGNREALPEATPLAGRADRAARNMLENMVLFIAAFAAAHAAGKGETTGAAIFFFARLAYWLVYLAGIPYLRTALWAVGLVGIGMVGLRAIG